MTRPEVIRLSLAELKNGEKYIVPESDYGLAEILKIHDCFLVFEIPTFGGHPRFINGFYSIDEVISLIETWT